VTSPSVAVDPSAKVDPGPPPRKSRPAQRLLHNIGWYGSALLLFLFIAVPIYLIFVSAVSTREAFFAYPKALIPTPDTISLANIELLFTTPGVIDAFWRSVIVGVITVVLALGVGAPAGYAIARFAFRGRDGYRLVVLATRAFPIVILSIPLAVTFRNFGIDDSVIGVAIVHTALTLPFVILITSSVFVSIPRELEEAAQTLGCSPWRAFLKISLPLALPGLVAAAIFTWVLSWNDVFAASILTVINQTLPAKILVGLSAAPPALRFAAGFILLVPSLIVIFIIRRYLLGLWGRVVK